MTDIDVSRVHFPVTVLGHGTRAGVWVQGCSLACTGCLAVDTWPVDHDRAVPVGDLLSWLAALPGPVDGVTVSGGEPLQQPDAVAELLDGIVAWRGDRPVDVLLFTGYAWPLPGRLRPVVARCDAVVAGRYVESLNVGGTALRGSTNQSVVALTPLGEARYGPSALAALPRTGIQAGVVDGRLWTVGIPGPGDLDRLHAGLAARGVRVGGASWRP